MSVRANGWGQLIVVYTAQEESTIPLKDVNATGLNTPASHKQLFQIDLLLTTLQCTQEAYH